MSYEDKKNKLKGLIKTNPATPIQEVKPVKAEKEPEFHINARIPINYEDRIKRYCLDHKLTIRQFVLNAIDKELN